MYEAKVLKRLSGHQHLVKLAWPCFHQTKQVKMIYGPPDNHFEVTF